MKLYRIATTAHIKDLSGAGARLYGGRWNEKGVAVVYTSESRALAVLEYLVHLPMVFAPGELSIMELKVPDSISPREVDRRSLPSDWRSYPAPEALAAIGTRWARSNDSLLLRVPSAVVEHEFNVLINPLHSDFNHITPRNPERFVFDSRLIAKRRE